jgi:hypothetical protein
MGLKRVGHAGRLGNKQSIQHFDGKSLRDGRLQSEDENGIELLWVMMFTYWSVCAV